MKGKIVYALAIIAVIAMFTFSTGSFPMKPVHAVPVVWFLSWIPTDDWHTNETYSYLYNVADSKTPTMNLVVTWGDGAVDARTVTGTWPSDNTPAAYVAIVVDHHIYTRTGTFTRQITLTDSLGNSVSVNPTVTISPYVGALYSSAVGGKTPLVT